MKFVRGIEKGKKYPYVKKPDEKEPGKTLADFMEAEE